MKCFLVHREQARDPDMDSLHFNAVLLSISDQLSSDQLNDLKFLCNRFIGKKILEKVSSGRDLFQLLTERQRLGADNTQFLSDLLEKVHRQDLSDKLNGFVNQSGSNDDHLDDVEEGTVSKLHVNHMS